MLRGIGSSEFTFVTAATLCTTLTDTSAPHTDIGWTSNKTLHYTHDPPRPDNLDDEDTARRIG